MDKAPIYKTQGIIIKSADLGELDRLIVIYSRGYGKIMARAISARKKESKLRGYLEPFTFSKFLLAKSKTIDIVTDVEPIETFSNLHGDLEALAHAFYFSEIIDKLIPAPEKDEQIWELVLKTFKFLNGNNSPQPSLNIREGVSNTPSCFKRGLGGVKKLPQLKNLFELKLLQLLGHGVSKNKNALDVIQGLAGEKINSVKFLMEE